MHDIDALNEMSMQVRMEADREVWFSMWFLASIVTFGVAFFPMFYHLIDNRNKHFRREAILEKQIANFLKAQGKEPPPVSGFTGEMNVKSLTASIILIIPAFIIIYYLSRDLRSHEEKQNRFLTSVFPKRIFMPQTIAIRRYALLTVATLGVGGIYWLYKIINLYNAHFKAQGEVEKEIACLMEAKTVAESV